MNRILIGIIAGSIVASGHVRAQDLFTMQGTEFKADWPRIKKCAATPYPNPWEPEIGTPMRNMAEHYFLVIHSCRFALLARQAGWIEAGGDPQTNPYPPEPISRPDDLKAQMSCDYSKLDKRGVGYVSCYKDWR